MRTGLGPGLDRAWTGLRTDLVESDWDRIGTGLGPDWDRAIWGAKQSESRAYSALMQDALGTGDAQTTALSCGTVQQIVRGVVVIQYGRGTEPARVADTRYYLGLSSPLKTSVFA